MSDGMHPAVLMYVVHRHVEDRVLARLAGRGFEDLTQAQGRIAARIDESGTRLTVLAERAGVTKQTAGVLVDGLVRGGYVERVPDPTDARARLVRLAPRGRRAQAVAREVEVEVMGEWEARLGTAGVTDLRTSLERLVGSLEARP